MASIRKATPQDIPQLATLLGFLFEQEAEFTADYDRQVKGLELIVQQPGVGELLVATAADDQIVGMVSLLYTVSTALGAEVAILEDMVVHPDSRGRGIGSELVSAALGHARGKGCQRVTLLTDIDDLAAEKFYQKHGFTLSPMVPLRQLLS